MNKLDREIVRLLWLPRAALVKVFGKQIALVFAASLLMAMLVPSPINLELLRFHVASIALITLVATPYIPLSPVQRVRKLRWGIALYGYGEQGLGWYAAVVERQIPALVYKLDMYHGRECSLDAGSKLAPLGDGRFLIATQVPSGGLQFLPPVSCGQ